MLSSTCAGLHDLQLPTASHYHSVDLVSRASCEILAVPALLPVAALMPHLFVAAASTPAVWTSKPHTPHKGAS